MDMNTETLMAPQTPIVAQTPNLLVTDDVRFHRSLSWGAIFAGVITAMGVHLLLLALGAGIGLATFTPLTDQNAAANFVNGSIVAWSLCALVALFTGGWIAGSFSAGPKSGCLHGVVVWSASMVITFFLCSTSGGLALGGVVKTLGAGLGMTGQAVAAGTIGAGTGELAKAGVSVNQGADQVRSFIDEALKSAPTNGAPGAPIRARREINFAVMRLFNPANDINSATNKVAVVQALTQYAGLSEADAKRMVNDWIASYKDLQAELSRDKAAAEQKARELAEKAARNLSEAATVAFFSFVMGLIVTMLGGICGANKTYRHTALGFVPEP